jgi:hypothetical protein
LVGVVKEDEVGEEGDENEDKGAWGEEVTRACQGWEGGGREEKSVERTERAEACWRRRKKFADWLNRNLGDGE